MAGSTDIHPATKTPIKIAFKLIRYAKATKNRILTYNMCIYFHTLPPAYIKVLNIINPNQAAPIIIVANIN